MVPLVAAEHVGIQKRSHSEELLRERRARQVVHQHSVRFTDESICLRTRDVGTGGLRMTRLDG